MRLLLAEDDADLAQVVVDALAEDGHTVTHVRAADDLRRLMSSGSWDAVILDSFGESHVELSEGEREVLAGLAARAPVILTTGRAWARSFQPGELGVAAIVPKPFDLQDLEQALARATD